MPTARPRQRLAGPDDAVRASGAGDDQGGGWGSDTAVSSISGTGGPLQTCAAWSLVRSLWCFLGVCASARVRRVGDYRCHVGATGSTRTGWKCRCRGDL